MTPLSKQWDIVTKLLVQFTKLVRNLDMSCLLQLIMGMASFYLIDIRNAEKMISDDGKSPHTAHTVFFPLHFHLT
jgi:hypothetical protein